MRHFGLFQSSGNVELEFLREENPVKKYILLLVICSQHKSRVGARKAGQYEEKYEENFQTLKKFNVRSSKSDSSEKIRLFTYFSRANLRNDG